MGRKPASEWDPPAPARRRPSERDDAAEPARRRPADEWNDAAEPARRRPVSWTRAAVASVVAVPLFACAGAALLPVRPYRDLGAGFVGRRRLDDAAPPATLAPAFLGTVPPAFTETTPTTSPSVSSPPTPETYFTVAYYVESVGARVSAMFVTFGSMLVVMGLLKLLLDMARKQIDDVPEVRLARDPFRSKEKGQDWNYDFVLVTAIKNEDHALTSELQKRNTMLRLVSALENADLETQQYKSRKFDKVFVKIRAPAARLAEEADRLNMKFRLDERAVKQGLVDGRPDPLTPGEYEIYPRRNGWTYRSPSLNILPIGSDGATYFKRTTHGVERCKK